MLLDRGMNHKLVTFSCLLLNMAFISLAYFGRSLGPTYAMLAILTASLGVLGAVMYVKRAGPAMDQPLQANNEADTHHPVTKVVPINAEAAVAEN
jgi:hypothetical protein